ncbi:MAG: hypothetical protein ACC608_05650 [Anaerofustis sp.]
MDYNILDYPNGYDRVRDEELVFLPEDKAIREGFMIDMLQWLIQW